MSKGSWLKQTLTVNIQSWRACSVTKNIQSRPALPASELQNKNKLCSIELKIDLIFTRESPAVKKKKFQRDEKLSHGMANNALASGQKIAKNRKIQFFWTAYKRIRPKIRAASQCRSNLDWNRLWQWIFRVGALIALGAASPPQLKKDPKTAKRSHSMKKNELAIDQKIAKKSKNPILLNCL